MRALLHFFIVGIIGATMLPWTAWAPAWQGPAERPEPEPYKNELRAVAEAKGLPEAKIAQIEVVIACESRWNPKAVGDGGESFGLVQIHLPAHPEITAEQALNPTFAINFIVDAWNAGDMWKWTCYKIHYS